MNWSGLQISKDSINAFGQGIGQKRSSAVPGGIFRDMLKTGSCPFGPVSGQGLSRKYGGGFTQEKPQPNGRLDDGDYEYLSWKWNPTKMSQDDYDDFLDFLQDKGMISEEDKEYVGYGGIRRASIGVAESWYSPDYPYYPWEGYEEGNRLADARYQASLIYEPPTPERQRQVELYRKIALILEAMARKV